MAGEILVPTDGSPESERAFDVAIPLARACGCTLKLMWAWEGLGNLSEVVAETVLDSIRQRESTDRANYLRDLGKRRCDPDDVGWVIHVPTGEPAEEIAKADESTSVRYVVMATHGRSGFKRWRLGSVADRVVRTTRKPTVLIRPLEGVTLSDTIRKIVVPLDGSEASESAVQEAVDVARPAGATLLLLRTVSAIVPASPVAIDTAYVQANLAAERAAVGHLTAIAERAADVPCETIVLMGDASSAIIEAAEEADLIVMASHGRGGLARLALGSVTDACIRGSGKPVMVVPWRRS